MLSLVGIEILISWSISLTLKMRSYLLCLLRETFYMQIQVMTWPEKKTLMEIKLFKYRCVVSLETLSQCCSRLKTKALLHKAGKKNKILSANHFIRWQRVTFDLKFIEKAVRKCWRKGSLSSLLCCPSQGSCAGSGLEGFVCYTPFQQGKQAAVLCLAAALFIQEIPSSQG